MKRPIFVTGIGTGVGKTIVSAILVEKLKADYWKPIQSGDLHDSDTMKVRSLVSNNLSVFHPEAYQLSQPFSPHKSAELDGVRIDINEICIPETTNQLVIEGAGGLMVPLNDHNLMLDLIIKLNAQVVLVSSNYLGSINHTLLSASVLSLHQVDIKSIVMCGKEDSYSEDIIAHYLQKKIISIPEFSVLDKSIIREFAAEFDL